jgi:hypothetical protein
MNRGRVGLLWRTPRERPIVLKIQRCITELKKVWGRRLGSAIGGGDFATGTGRLDEDIALNGNVVGSTVYRAKRRFVNRRDRLVPPRPIKPRARQQLHLIARDSRMNSVTIEFDLVTSGGFSSAKGN